jgi:hypothetical protein
MEFLWFMFSFQVRNKSVCWDSSDYCAHAAELILWSLWTSHMIICLCMANGRFIQITFWPLLQSWECQYIILYVNLYSVNFIAWFRKSILFGYEKIKLSNTWYFLENKMVYVAHLKNAVYSPVAWIYKMNLLGSFLTCVSYTG